MRIGIYGGSFNPPHNMHKNIPLLLIDKNYVDKVIYVPTGDKYNKKNLINSIHRYNMLKLICNDKLDVSDYEIKNNLVYTYQTLDYFNNLYKDDEIYLIVGSDNFNDITSWKNYKYILNKYKILVIMRNNDILKDYDNVIICNIEKDNISSTEIRSKIKNKDSSILENIDKNVLKYIMDRKLYME